ncbi:histidine kinase dimerization/phospho-acceptor domain-containing protein [Vulcanococcus sp. Clear-D1]|uniref:histidine kinase dimerization/phospho-acceptor domain-containing protein n=1 Tax=Vulcanococcus sp. Clear-D1 TaxID=2766970 RepID=UPI0019A375C4|nr:histidine kinase dimerization/phospho-acceptor domain-containing protein [Vulcanococcus sp. Clear-D1]MBD1193051.1 HAMP domain-containing histidine kinase [Vulcanococcus sp. Clear-D1]
MSAAGEPVSLEQLRHRLAEGVPAGSSDDDSVRRQWWAALATLQEDFLLPLGAQQGVWMASPLPALHEPALLQQLQGWVWAPAELGDLLQAGSPLLPPGVSTAPARAAGGFQRLPLLEADGTDPLLLVLTPRLQVAMALLGDPGQRRLVVRFDPPTLSAALSLLDERLQHTDPKQGQRLRQAIQALGPLQSDEQLAQRFWPRLAERLAAMAPSLTLQPLVHRSAAADATAASGPSSELALLEALTHEVRTPLATIRTLIRSLLRRSDLPELVRQRLQQIDGECSEQIDRFGLIFLAAELQREPPSEDQALARTDLARLLEQLEPVWRQQLLRRSLAMELRCSPELPPVLSDPARLETVLGGLVDRFSRGLPAGAVVRLSLQPAGARLKLRFSASAAVLVEPGEAAAAERVGPVLSWNPGTGSLQLSRQATQRLFHSLGGRLAERAGNDLTVFFPVAQA